MVHQTGQWIDATTFVRPAITPHGQGVYVEVPDDLDDLLLCPKLKVPNQPIDDTFVRLNILLRLCQSFFSVIHQHL